MSSHPDVLVMGGGVIGLTAAYFLAREGLAVEVVDQGGLGQEASWAGAGILPPGNPAQAPTPFDQLGAHSAALYPVLSAELRERTGIDNGYMRSGGLEFVDGDEGTVDEWRAQGVAYEHVTGTQLHRLEPAVNTAVGSAYFLPDMAQLRNPRHVKALIAGCADLGVAFYPGCPVRMLERRRDHITSALTSAGPMSAGRYLAATGAWSDALLGALGWRPGIRPVRGQIALLNTGAPVLRRILLQGKRYLVPRGDGRVLAGSTEEEAGFDKRTTARAIAGLLKFAIELVPALADAPLERAWAGLRPASSDGLPYIGQVPGVDNLFMAAGHFRSGIQQSPATALVLKELFLGQELTVSLDAFRLDRASAQATGSPS
jgi:glycine oxidase